MSIFEIILFFGFAYIAAVFATLAGFGSSTLLIPVAIFFMDLKTAVFIVACFHLFNNLLKVKLFFSKIDYRLFSFFGVSSILCAFLGASLINVFPSAFLQKFLAVFLLVFSVFSFTAPSFKVQDTQSNAILGGSLSGFLAGLIGLGGAVRAMFLISFPLPKEVYVATSALIALVVDVTRISTYLFVGTMKDNNLLLLLPSLFVVAYVGVKTGKLWLGRIDQNSFRKIVLSALFLVGLKLLFF